MDRRTKTVLLVLLIGSALMIVGCEGGSPAGDTAATVATAGGGLNTESTAPPSVDAGSSTSGTTSSGDAGSSADVDPSTLLTDEEAAEYFGVPAKHEGPTAIGLFANITYSPVDGSGQMIIITTLGKDTLETFEYQVKAENEALGEEPQAIEGIGEKAYYTVSTVRFFKSGGTYQVTASNPQNGEDLITALVPLARAMASRVP